MGAEHGANKERQTWLERQQEEAETLGSTTQPYVLVVGGGQAGIGLGARLRQLGIPSLVIDKHGRPGDQWRSRYKSLCLHDPVWYDHMPYLKFPDNWPVFSPKDKIGGLAGVLHPGDGGALLVEYDGDERVVLGGEGGVDRRGRARRQAGHAAAQAARAGHRDVRQAEHPRPAGHGRLQGRPAPLLGAPRSGRVRRQEVRRHREQQLRLRHLRGTVGARRGRHDGAAVLDPHRQERHA